MIILLKYFAITIALIIFMPILYFFLLEYKIYYFSDQRSAELQAQNSLKTYCERMNVDFNALRGPFIKKKSKYYYDFIWYRRGKMAAFVEITYLPNDVIINVDD
jgi:hypothetical protein